MAVNEVHLDHGVTAIKRHCVEDRETQSSPFPEEVALVVLEMVEAREPTGGAWPTYYREFLRALKASNECNHLSASTRYTGRKLHCFMIVFEWYCCQGIHDCQGLDGVSTKCLLGQRIHE